MASAALCMAMVVVVLGQFWLSEAAGCDPQALLGVCGDAVSKGTPPSAACCATTKEQYGCLCGYLKNPDLGKYRDPAKKILVACHLQIPSC